MEKLKIDRNFYAGSIGALKNSLKNKKILEGEVRKLEKEISESQTHYVKLLNAQKILSTLSDDNTKVTLDFISSMVNKVLMEMFPNDTYRVELKKKLYAGNKPHINLTIYGSDGYVLEQTGDGVKQVITFMYVICLIEIQKGRRLLLLDERLNGLHKSAKNCIASIIKIFQKGGFQFIFVEYGLNNLGKIYNVERRNNMSKLVSFEGDYHDEIVYIDDVDLSVLDEEYDSSAEEAEE